MAEVELPNPEELRHERGEDRFGRRVALVTAVFAVILSISSLGGNNATKEMLLAQQKSSDQWAFYQAKVIREHLYRAQKLRLEADLLERGGPSDWRPARRSSRRSPGGGTRRRSATTPRRRTSRRTPRSSRRCATSAATRDPYFDLAEVFLQIAIVMSSVSILSKSRPVFYFSLLLAVVGATLTLNGYFLFFQLPWLHESH